MHAAAQGLVTTNYHVRTAAFLYCFVVVGEMLWERGAGPLAWTLLALQFLATGTPMMLMGDEVRHTQYGNNNAYCRDAPSNWFDWGLLARHADVHRFVKRLIAFRARRDVVTESAGLTLNQLLERAEIDWHGVRLHHPDWGDASHSLAFTVRSLTGRFRLHVMLNAYWEPLVFEVPPAPDGGLEPWRRVVDTSLASPDDFISWGEAPAVPGASYAVAPRSIAALILRLRPDVRTAPAHVSG